MAFWASPKIQLYCYWFAFYLLLGGIFLLMRCNPLTSSDKEQTFILDHYIAQLQLDSTTLVVSQVAQGLDIPWEICWGADSHIWFSQQNGQVIRLNPQTGVKQVVLQVPDVHYQKSRGLLGMALHPDFVQNPYVYLHYTFLDKSQLPSKVILSRLVRYTYQDEKLINPLVLLDSIPGKTYHNGSRVLIGPDKKLYLSTGDAGNPEKCQDENFLSGKILRLNLDGSIPEDNPYPKNPVWSMGHRNPQGLVFASNGLFYSSEHGPNNDDEVNIIQRGKNYGWPNVHGFCDLENEKAYCQKTRIEEPLFAWTPTIAVSGLDYYGSSQIPEWKNNLILANLKGRALRTLQLNSQGDKIVKEHIFFQKFFGRIRDICIAPNGDIYLCTSNKDWHPQFQPWMYEGDSLPHTQDDQIIRLSVANTKMLSAIQEKFGKKQVLLSENKNAAEMPSEDWNYQADGDQLAQGKILYQKHCAGCHQPEGQGVKGLIPPLANTDWVTGDKDRLIHTVLSGISSPIEVNGTTYEQEMPGFAALLTDEELAAVLSFLRKNFGNDAVVVLAAEVKEERKSLP